MKPRLLSPGTFADQLSVPREAVRCEMARVKYRLRAELVGDVWLIPDSELEPERAEKHRRRLMGVAP